MSRYNNVRVLLATAENYNLEEITSLIYRLEESSEAEDMAEDIAFVLISMWALVPQQKKYVFIDRLTDEMVEIEIKKMFPEIRNTHCVNCGWTVSYEDGEWDHDDLECPCIDPSPFLSEI